MKIATAINSLERNNRLIIVGLCASLLLLGGLLLWNMQTTYAQGSGNNGNCHADPRQCGGGNGGNGQGGGQVGIGDATSTDGNNNGRGGGGGGGNAVGADGLTPEEKQKGYRDVCGKDNNRVPIKFDLGCVGDQLPPKFKNPIYDLAFALIRFLSAGVGIVVIIAIILAGIKYSTSEGNPEATAQAKNSIQNALIALLLYIFAFAIINYLVPGGFFNS